MKAGQPVLLSELRARIMEACTGSATCGLCNIYLPPASLLQFACLEILDLFADQFFDMASHLLRMSSPQKSPFDIKEHKNEGKHKCNWKSLMLWKGSPPWAKVNNQSNATQYHSLMLWGSATVRLLGCKVYLGRKDYTYKSCNLPKQNRFTP